MSRTRPGRRPIAAATAALVGGALVSVVPPAPAALEVGVWGPVEDLGVVSEVFDNRDPALVRVRGDRTAVAAWVDGDDWAPAPVTVSERAAGGGWTAPLGISADLPGDATYALDVGGPGLASVVWERKVGGAWRIEESHLDGGAWTAPVRVGSGRDPETVVDGTDVTTVAWRNHGVRAARRTETGTWSPPRRVAAGAVSSMELAANPDGDVVVAWTARYRKVRAAVRPRGPKPWAAPETLDRGQYVTSLRVAMGGSGRALVLWTVADIWDEAAHDYQNYLAWARSDVQGHWARTRRLTDRLGEDGGAADLSMNGKGQALATWLQVYRSDSPTYLWAARFRPDGTWSAPVRVARVSWSEPEAWLDRNGGAHVVVNRRAIWHFSQRPGAAWTDAKLNRGRVVDAHGMGDRLVMLFHRSTLRSRTLEVH